MAAKTFYFIDGLAGGSNHLEMQDGGSAPVLARASSGWVVGTLTPTLYSSLDSQTERATAAHTGTALPNLPPENTLGDCFRSSGTYNGTFSSGIWNFSFQVQGQSRSTSTHDGRLRLKLWRSSNADGSSATELTSGTAISTSQYANLANTVYQTISGTASMPSIVLTDEYIFMQVAHQLDGAGNNANSDTRLAVGSSNFLLTTDFTATEPPQTKSVGDTSSSSDNFTISASLNQSDFGLSTESASISASLYQNDFGSGVDNINIFEQIVKLINDVASALDYTNIQASVSAIEASIASDTLYLNARVSLFDSSVSVDSPNLAAALGIIDGALGGDFLDLDASLTSRDTSSALDNLSSSASLSVRDLSSASESIFVSAITEIIKSIQEYAYGLDVQNVYVSIQIQDSVVGADEIAQLIASLLLSDSITGVDSTSVTVISYAQLFEISCIIENSTITFAIKQPSIGTELTKPKMTFDFLGGIEDE